MKPKEKMYQVMQILYMVGDGEAESPCWGEGHDLSRGEIRILLNKTFHILYILTGVAL